jgi:hypothetical protein
VGASCRRGDATLAAAANRASDAPGARTDQPNQTTAPHKGFGVALPKSQMFFKKKKKPRDMN